MKNFFFFLLFIMASTTAFSQQSSANDSNSKVVPVLRSYVAPNVVARAVKKYGRSLYCIEKAKKNNCEDSYLVGLIHNGKLTMEWMCEELKIAFHFDETIFIIEEALVVNK